jgi:tetratricopeptide (TPR) repeat protein
MFCGLCSHLDSLGKKLDASTKDENLCIKNVKVQSPMRPDSPMPFNDYYLDKTCEECIEKKDDISEEAPITVKGETSDGEQVLETDCFSNQSTEVIRIIQCNTRCKEDEGTTLFPEIVLSECCKTQLELDAVMSTSMTENADSNHFGNIPMHSNVHNDFVNSCADKSEKLNLELPMILSTIKESRECVMLGKNEEFQHLASVTTAADEEFKHLASVTKAEDEEFKQCENSGTSDSDLSTPDIEEGQAYEITSNKASTDETPLLSVNHTIDTRKIETINKEHLPAKEEDYLSQENRKELDLYTSPAVQSVVSINYNPDIALSHIFDLEKCISKGATPKGANCQSHDPKLEFLVHPSVLADPGLLPLKVSSIVDSEEDCISVSSRGDEEPVSTDLLEHLTEKLVSIHEEEKHEKQDEDRNPSIVGDSPLADMRILAKNDSAFSKLQENLSQDAPGRKEETIRGNGDEKFQMFGIKMIEVHISTDYGYSSNPSISPESISYSDDTSQSSFGSKKDENTIHLDSSFIESGSSRDEKESRGLLLQNQRDDGPCTLIVIGDNESQEDVSFVSTQILHEVGNETGNPSLKGTPHYKVAQDTMESVVNEMHEKSQECNNLNHHQRSPKEEYLEDDRQIGSQILEVSQEGKCTSNIEKSEDGMKEQLEVATIKMDKDQMLGDNVENTEVVVPEGSKNSNTDAPVQVSIKPLFLIKSLDDHEGICKGDIMVSLIYCKKGQEPSGNDGRGEVSNAVWRMRNVRRLCNTKDSKFSNETICKEQLSGQERYRVSLPVDVDDVHIVGAAELIQSLEAKALDHLKHDEFDDALDLYEDVMYSYVTHFGVENDMQDGAPCSSIARQYIGNVWHNMGLIYMLKDDYRLALDCLEKAAEKRNSMDEGLKSAQLITMVKLAMCHFALGHWTRAHSNLELCLRFAKSRRKRMTDYLQIAEILNNMGCVTFMGGDVEAAKVFLLESSNLQRAVMNHDLYEGSVLSSHATTLNFSITYANVAFLLMDSHEYVSAISSLEKSLRMQQTFLHDSHEILLCTMDHLAKANHLAGRTDKALSMLNRMLQAHSGLFGDDDPRCEMIRLKVSMIQRNERKPGIWDTKSHHYPMSDDTKSRKKATTRLTNLKTTMRKTSRFRRQSSLQFQDHME